jgi:hypothetical protein
MYSRYPVLTCVIILPLSVVRLKTLKNQTSIPTVGLFIGVFPIALSGVLNAVLYVITRRHLLLSGRKIGAKVNTAHALFHVEGENIRSPSPVAETGNVQVSLTRNSESVTC